MNDGPLAEYRFFIPGDPVSTNRLWRIGWHRHLYKTAEAHRITEDIQRRARGAGVEYDDRHKWRLSIDYRHRHPQRHLDVGNVEKLVGDALQGIAYPDDKAVTRLVVTEAWNPDDPGLEVRLEVTDEPYPTEAARRKVKAKASVNGETPARG